MTDDADLMASLWQIHAGELHKQATSMHDRLLAMTNPQRRGLLVRHAIRLQAARERTAAMARLLHEHRDVPVDL